MSGSINHAAPIVFIIDDDASFRRSIGRLIQSMGFQVKTFGTSRGVPKHGTDRRTVLYGA